SAKLLKHRHFTTFRPGTGCPECKTPVFVNARYLPESCAEPRAQDVKEEPSSNHSSEAAAKKVTSQQVHEISNYLRRQDNHAQSPCPHPLLKPAESACHQNDAEEIKDGPDKFSNWCERDVGRLIQSPQAVEPCSWPDQHCSGEGRHA